MIDRLTNVRFFNGGFCRQSAYLAGVRSLRIKRFYAVFVYFEHPRHGRYLIDTGYGPQFWDATRSLPQRVYRWLTPVKLDDDLHAAGVLSRHGVDPREIDGVFVSHYHADHIAGLREFEHASFIAHRESLESLQRLTKSRQVRHGFLPDLLPDDFDSRGRWIDESPLLPDEGLESLPTRDYWGDGSLLVVELPGHAEGHLGFVLNTRETAWFYIVDACWEMDALRSNRRLPTISRGFQHDFEAYQRTQEQLRRIESRSDLKMLACHCSETQNHVAAPAD